MVAQLQVEAQLGMALAKGSDDRCQITHSQRHRSRHAQHARQCLCALPGHLGGLVQQGQRRAGTLSDGAAFVSDAQVPRVALDAGSSDGCAGRR